MMTKKATIQQHVLRILAAWRDENEGRAGLRTRSVHFRVCEAMGEKVGKAIVRRALVGLEDMDLVRDTGNGRKSFWYATTPEERSKARRVAQERQERQELFDAMRARLDELQVDRRDHYDEFRFTPAQMRALLERVS